MKAIAHFASKLQGILKMLLTGIIYLSFFFVQFDLHLGKSPVNLSYFSGDNTLANISSASGIINNSGLSRKGKQVHIRLNKRFHPEKFVIVYSSPSVPAPILVGAVVVSFIVDQPLVRSSYRSPSWRGPPVLV
jgi:hypothetical protein